MNEVIATDKKYFDGVNLDSYYENYYKITRNSDKYFEFLQKRIDKIVNEGLAGIETKNKEFVKINTEKIKENFTDEKEAEAKIQNLNENYGKYVYKLISNEINSAAWGLAVNYKNDKNKNKLTKALAWSKFSTELNPEDFNFYDTYACISYLLGDTANAIKLEEKAAKLASTSGEQESLDDFKSKIELMESQ